MARLILKIGSSNAMTMNPTSEPTMRINMGASNEISVLVFVRMWRSSMSATF